MCFHSCPSLSLLHSLSSLSQKMKADGVSTRDEILPFFFVLWSWETRQRRALKISSAVQRQYSRNFRAPLIHPSRWFMPGHNPPFNNRLLFNSWAWIWIESVTSHRPLNWNDRKRNVLNYIWNWISPTQVTINSTYFYKVFFSTIYIYIFFFVSFSRYVYIYCDIYI